MRRMVNPAWFLPLHSLEKLKDLNVFTVKLIWDSILNSDDEKKIPEYLKDAPFAVSYEHLAHWI